MKLKTIPSDSLLSALKITGIVLSIFSVIAFSNPLLTEASATVSPLRLSIPKIKVTAEIESVGLTKTGAMEVPGSFANAAWFNQGPTPGSEGSSIIDGHSGWKNGKPAVFENLYKLQKGDKIYVQDASGKTTTFLVRETRIYDKNEDASGVFTSNDGKAHLNLITCTGIWNKVEKTHSDRMVVFADKE